jgi:branched-chain amino acid transport system ATP-binding protein
MRGSGVLTWRRYRSAGQADGQPGVLGSGTAGRPQAARGLQVGGLSVDYGYGPVVQNLSLHVAPGELMALIGPNGAGKSSTLRGIMGLVPAAGSVSVDGMLVSRASPHARARSGLGYVAAERSLFDPLTVRQHLELVLRKSERPALFQEAAEMFPALGRLHRQEVVTLSGGERQMLALALTLLRKPSVLLIDELSTGLAPKLLTELLQRCRHIADQGMAVLLVEQAATAALRVADRAVLLSHGEIVLDEAASALQDRSHEIRQLYMGAGHPRKSDRKETED